MIQALDFFVGRSVGIGLSGIWANWAWNTLEYLGIPWDYLGVVGSLG
jgi:hypothetical protein